MEDGRKGCWEDNQSRRAYKLRLDDFMDGPDHTEPYKAQQGVRVLFIILKTTEGFEAEE